jgi:PKD repeat protein
MLLLLTHSLLSYPGYWDTDEKPLFSENVIKIQLAEEALNGTKLPDGLYEEAFNFGIPELDVLFTRNQGQKIIRAHRRLKDADWEAMTGFNRWFLIEFSQPVDVLKIIAEFKAHRLIEEAIPEYYAYPAFVPNDPHYSANWGHNNTRQFQTYQNGAFNGLNVGTIGFDTRAELAWDDVQGLGAPSVVIAIIDTGADFDHQDLRLVHYGWNFGINNSDITDRSGHGTACAGIAAAIGDNNLGVVGIAGGCSVLALKVSTGNWDETITFTAINNAITYAADNNATVISMSLWDFPAHENQATNDAIEYAYSFDIPIFACTANANYSWIGYPANHPKIIAVGAASPCGTRKNFISCDGHNSWGSHYGVNLQDDPKSVDILGPTLIPTTDPTGNGLGYTTGYYNMWFGGTSAATPYIAGVAALMLSKNPSLSNDEIRIIINETATYMPINESYGSFSFVGNQFENFGWNRFSGYGFINAAKALLDMRKVKFIKANPVGDDKIRIEWIKNSNHNNIILSYSEDGYFEDPIDGLSYQVGHEFNGGGKIIYQGNNDYYEHENLQSSKLYFYRCYSFNNMYQYSAGLDVYSPTDYNGLLLPYSQNFSGSIFPPELWEIKEYTGEAYNWFGSSYHGVHSGTHAAASKSYDDRAGYQMNPKNLLLTPKFQIKSNIGKISFWQKIYIQNQYTPGFVVDRYDITVFDDEGYETIIYEGYCNSELWEKIEIPFWGYSGKEIKFGIYHNEGNLGVLLIDDIVIEEANANFSISINPAIIGQTVIFTDLSTGPFSNWSWDFGNEAFPETANTKGPHSVTFYTHGNKTISLTLDGVETKTIDIEVLPTSSFTITPMNLNYVDVSINSTSNLQFTFINNATTTITGTMTTPSNAFIVSESAKGIVANNPLTKNKTDKVKNSISYSIEAASSKQFNVSFNPSSIIDYSGLLEITTNLMNIPQINIFLSGTVNQVLPLLPIISIPNTNIVQRVSTTETSTKNFILSNVGQSALHFTASIDISKRNFTTVLYENFEGGILPQGWDISSHSAVGWQIVSDGSSYNWHIPHGNGYYACSNDDSAGDDGSNDILITPFLDLSRYKNAILTFYSYYDGVNGQSARLLIDWGNGWNVLYNDFVAQYMWRTQEIDLTPYCHGYPPVRLGFHSDDNSDSGSGWAIDDVLVMGLESNWLTINHGLTVSGFLAPYETFYSLLHFDSHELSEGLYSAVITIVSNDAASPHTVSVDFYVDNSQSSSSSAGGNNAGTGTVYVDVPAILVNDMVINPDVSVTPSQDMILALDVTVSSNNLNYVANPENVLLSYQMNFLTELQENHVTFSLTYGSLEPTMLIYHNGVSWQTISDMSWEEDKVTFDIFISSTKSNKEFILASGDTPLPVTLSSFYAVQVQSNAQLNWATQSEVNNSGWNIYRSVESDFSEAAAINQSLIPGAGTTSDITEYSYEDFSEFETGETFYYWLESIDYGGICALFGPVSIVMTSDPDNPNMPPSVTFYGLAQNYPNPFNPNTDIMFRLPQESYVTLTIYNLKGERVSKLYSGNSEAEKIHKFSWNGKNDKGKAVASGIYFYQLTSNDKSEVKKMLLIK